MTWKRYCGTVAKAGGNGEHKLRPVVKEGSYLLESTQRKTLCPQERRSKGRDIAGWEIDSLVEGEAVLRG